MEILVRLATPEDAASLARVEVTSWQAAYRGLMPDAFLAGLSAVEKREGWRRNLLKHRTSGRKRVLAAVAENEIIGFTRVGSVWDEGQVGLVYLLYVLPAYWGRGVGTVLMNAAMDELRDLGVKEAVLWVLCRNVRARRFYERLGWRPDGRTNSEDYGGVALDALCYRRVVDAW